MEDIEIKGFYLSDNEKRIKVALSIGRKSRRYNVFAYHHSEEGEKRIFKTKEDDRVVGQLTFEMFLEGREEVVRLQEE